MTWGLVIAGVGTVAGAAISSNASSKASKAQQGAADAATQLAQQQYDQTRTDQAPYRQAGYSALDRLQTLLGLNPSTLPASQQTQDKSWQNAQNFDPQRYLAENPDVAAAGKDPLTHWLQAGQFEGRQFPAIAGAGPASVAAGAATDPTKDPMYGYLTKQFTGADLQNEPGYQFGLQQGTQATERSASARGGLYSGATLKALQKYGQDYAGTKYGEAFNRDQVNKNTLFNQLSGISGTGQVATSQVGQAGQQYATSAANNAYGAANASAANSLAQGNILNNGINQTLSMWQRAQTQGNKTAGGGTLSGLYDPGGDGGYAGYY